MGINTVFITINIFTVFDYQNNNYYVYFTNNNICKSNCITKVTQRMEVRN